MRVVADSNNNEKGIVSILYIQSVSHRLKKVWCSCGVNVFTAANKLGKMCAAVYSTYPQNEQLQGKKWTDICQVKHTADNNFIDRRTGVVYEIPFSCEEIYVGQTARSINQRINEHRKTLSGGMLSNLSLHCRDCNCTPKLDKCTILYMHKNEEACLMVKAWHQ